MRTIKTFLMKCLEAFVSGVIKGHDKVRSRK